MKYLGKK